MHHLSPSSLAFLYIILTVTAISVTGSSAGWYTPSKVSPLSSLDPIHDLGLASVTRTHGVPSSTLFGDTRAPLATNKWYMNSVLGTGSDMSNDIVTLPMVHQASSSLISYYPNILLHGNGHYQNVWDPIIGGVSLGSVETDAGGTGHQLTNTDELTATLVWNHKSDHDHTSSTRRMQSTLVRGSPYTTMSYASLTPLLATKQTLVRFWVDGHEHRCNGGRLPMAKRFTFHLRQFDMTWQLWSSHPLQLRCEASPTTSTSTIPVASPAPTPSPAPITPDNDEYKKHLDDSDDDDNDVKSHDNDDDSDDMNNGNEAITSNAGFVLKGVGIWSGTLSLALLNNCTSGSNTLWCPTGSSASTGGVDQSEYAALLERHHMSVVTGAQLQWNFGDDNNEAQYSFDWNVVPFTHVHHSLVNDITSHAAAAASFMSLSSSSRPSTLPLSMASTCSVHHSSTISMADATLLLAQHNTNHIPTLNQHTVPIINTVDESSPSPPDPLLFALPHHIDAFTSSMRSSIIDGNGHHNIRGWLQPVISSTWTMRESLTSIGFRSARPIDSQYMDQLRRSVRSESNYDLPVNYRTGTGDPYFAGKLLARMARLILIADECDMMDIVHHLVPRLKNYTSLWLHGLSANKLVYDPLWGGIISCGCRYNDGDKDNEPYCDNAGPPNDCPTVSDPGFDFGNGFYNDHHLQFGYHIYAAAVVAHFDKEFVKSSGQHVTALIRSIANPSSNDPFFPTFRQMDWYEGHSWAGGIPQSFQLGRNQESSSEAINAWYSVYLWGLVTDDSFIQNVGRLLLSVEQRSVQMYWHIPDNSPVYPSTLWPNRMVGILWSNLAQYSTWFGAAAYEAHGIQLLPITPITESLIPAPFAAQQWHVFDDACTMDPSCTDQGWISLLVCNQAIAQRDAAWSRALSLPNKVFDHERAGGNGNSRSNTLYWIATRPPS